MTLFTLLLVMLQERLFKLGEHWQLDHRLEPLFRHITRFSLLLTLLMTLLAVGVVALGEWLLQGWFFNLPLVVFWILVGTLCIGAGVVRKHYHQYLEAARKGDDNARDAMVSELTLIHGVPPDCSRELFLRELQNALLWINYRFYLAPLLCFVAGGPYGPATLMGYAVLRAWQTWLARHHTPYQRLQSGIDWLLHVIDWIPVRLVGVCYALLGHGEKALPAWFASLGDLHTSQYQVLTRLAQFSLARDPHLDDVETPRAAVSLAKKTSLIIVMIVALLTIYGTLL
ncbi:beta-lactamase regulator AmpE [Salmonella enterica subsp. enterica serovar Choleraesuis]|nr:beta-lactamase regulator AmpE [Salmonella enterica subsp. enterica serovar Choleraesuis]